MKTNTAFKPLEELSLMDDYMFAAVMRDEINLKPLLEYILSIKVDEIAFVEPQKTEKEGYQSHGIRLDLYVKDESGQVFNVEVQTSTQKNLPKRMRYYQSVIDINILAPGVDYNNLSKSVVIFICNFDPFEDERYIYTFENRCLEDPDLSFDDETIKVVVNTKGKKGNISQELKELIDYLNEGIVTGAYTRQLDDAVQLVKASEERRHEYMVMMIRDMEKREEGREEGLREGREEGLKEGLKEGREEGLKEGREKGRIVGTVETMRDDGKDNQAILSRLIGKYGLTQEEAKVYVFPDPTTV